MNSLPNTRTVMSIATLIALAACTPASDHEADEHETPHWSYDGDTGPDHWGTMNETFSACSEGTAQSPIDIAGAEAQDGAAIMLHYQSATLNIVNNGHTVQVNHDAASSTMAPAGTFSLKQFHFHAPSEHTVDGRSFPAEVHLVHQAEDGTLAVFGILIEEGEANEAYASVLANLPADAGEAHDVADVAIDPATLLPEDLAYYGYDGSLTTPPCSEGVKWHVLANPVQLSAEQIAAYTAIYSGNNRPVQPLNERTVGAQQQ